MTPPIPSTSTIRRINNKGLSTGLRLLVSCCLAKSGNDDFIIFRATNLFRARYFTFRLPRGTTGSPMMNYMLRSTEPHVAHLLNFLKPHSFYR